MNKELHFFLNPNELGHLGWQAVRPLVLSGERVVCWAPATLFLEQCRANDPFLPSPEELLWYVEHGHLRVIGRKWWIYNTGKRRERRWEAAGWRKGFDDRIVEMMVDDANKKLPDPRVRVVAEEDGFEWAEQVLGKGVDTGALLRIVREGGMPTGIREKMERQSSDTERAKWVLRDVRNYFRARDDAGVRHIYCKQDEFEFFAKVLGAIGSSPKPATQVEQAQIHVPPERLIVALLTSIEAIANSGRPPKSSKECFERTQAILLDPKALREVRTHDDLVLRALSSFPADTEAAEHYIQSLVDQIDRGVVKSTASELLRFEGPARAICFLGGLVVATAGLSMTGGATVAVLGLGLTLAERMTSVLEGVSAIPDRRYNGPRWPLILAYGSKEIERKRIQRVIDVLRKPPSGRNA